MSSRFDYRPLTRRARILSAGAAVLGSLAAIGAVLTPFHEDGKTPWVRAGQAALVAHCPPPAGSPTQRHDCLQAAASERTTTRVAAR